MLVCEMGHHCWAWVAPVQRPRRSTRYGSMCTPFLWDFFSSLARSSPNGGPALERREPEPYRLRAVGHSLGGMSLLIHTVMAKAQGKPSRVHRLILFTPAGVHAQLPRVGGSHGWR